MDETPLSIWLAEAPPVPTLAAGELPERADIVIVGGGLIGTALALALTEAGHEPLVLERDRVANGASGRNGGLLLPGTAEHYPRLVDRWGLEFARGLWELSLGGAEHLVRWIQDYHIDCAFRQEGGLHVASSTEEANHLRRMTDELTRDGFPALWMDRNALSTWSALELPAAFEGASLLPGGGPLHSGRMVAGLARAATERGARFAEGMDVTAVSVGQGSGTSVEVKVDVTKASDGDRHPRTILADRVVICTNAWTARLMPTLAEVITPVRGQVMCTAPLKPGLFRGAWSMNDGYEYLQQLPDGRVVFGGLRWQAVDWERGHVVPELNTDIQSALGQWLASNFPDLGDWEGQPVPAERRWAGIMAFTPDRLPLIGPVTGTGERLWLACAFNGHGLPFAGVSATLVAAGLAGERQPDVARAFAPSRFEVSSAPR